MFQASMYFIVLHFSALTNAQHLISRKVITFEKEMHYFGFLSTTIFIWRNGLKGIGVWLNSWNFLANLGFILHFKIIVDISEINEIYMMECDFLV